MLGKKRRVTSKPVTHDEQQRDLKETSYKIRLAANEINRIQGKPPVIEDLRQNVFIRLELGKGLPYYCRCNLNGARPPLTLEIHYEKNSVNTIKFYGSFEVSEPSSRNRDVERRGRPKEIKIMPKPDARAYDYGSYHYFYICI